MGVARRPALVSAAATVHEVRRVCESAHRMAHQVADEPAVHGPILDIHPTHRPRHRLLRQHRQRLGAPACLPSIRQDPSWAFGIPPHQENQVSDTFPLQMKNPMNMYVEVVNLGMLTTIPRFSSHARKQAPRQAFLGPDSAGIDLIL